MDGLGPFRRAGVDEFQAVTVGVGEAFLDEGDRELGDVDANPLAAEFLGGVNRGAATAERIKDYVAGIAAGGDNALQEGHGFLCRET